MAPEMQEKKVCDGNYCVGDSDLDIKANDNAE
jgi:hypothetical protein